MVGWAGWGGLAQQLQSPALPGYSGTVLSGAGAGSEEPRAAARQRARKESKAATRDTRR